jgi:DNA-binding CsgD family transcriptional regulator
MIRFAARGGGLGDDETTVRPFRRDEGDATTRWQLRVVAGGATGRVLVLHGGELIIGRDAKADLRLTDSGVSRRHAKVMSAGDGTTVLIDLDSTNGTLVNDARVELASLRLGHRVRIGPVAELVCEAVPAQGEAAPHLTERELEIARLVIAGMSNPQIAQQLGIRPRTVGTHLENVYRRLGIGSRAELAMRLSQAKLT